MCKPIYLSSVLPLGSFWILVLVVQQYLHSIKSGLTAGTTDINRGSACRRERTMDANISSPSLNWPSRGFCKIETAFSYSLFFTFSILSWQNRCAGSVAGALKFFLCACSGGSGFNCSYYARCIPFNKKKPNICVGVCFCCACIWSPG